VTPIDPLPTIEAALTRPTWAAGLPDERQTLQDTLASYTLDNAYADFMDHRKGMLRSGYLADIVVLSGDLESLKPEAYRSIKPVLTICDGEVTYQA
jgi:predicted amidohydrolase YtcJ